MTIQLAYINALLADASYVPPAAALDSDAMKARMTDAQAAFLAANFTILNSIESPKPLGMGFDAVVWQGKPGTLYANQVFISMRGTQGLEDIADDASLAASGVPVTQIVDMVNWWLRIRTLPTEQAQQIQYQPLSGYTLAAPVSGTGELSTTTDITSVNGHSLGGYLATAFTRLFGDQAGVQSVSTFNSAGFSNAAALNIENSYDQIANALGLTGSFSSTGAKQTNYFGENGINFTTNSLADISLPGFNQYGQRVGLYQEDLLTGSFPAINNHSMYKLTDYLALGATLEKLDPSLSFAKLDTVVRASSNDMAASYEGVFDAVRKALDGPNVQALPIGDVSGSAESRAMYHATLVAFQNSSNALAGQLLIRAADADLRAAARNNFGALIALQDLSPLWVSGKDEAANAQLQAIWQTSRSNDYFAWLADRSADTPSSFTDAWILDRTTMVAALVQRNTNNATNPTGSINTDFVDLGQGVMLAQRLNGAGVNAPANRIVFGGATGESLNGTNNVLGDRIYGGGGNDTVIGLTGNDYLEGNAGNDSLVGGVGNDTLVGGTGVDIYVFVESFDLDTVIDSDGLGQINIDGQVVGQGVSIIKVGNAVWETADQTFTFSLTDLGLVITRHSNSGTTAENGTVLVKNWVNGQLGITLPVSTPAPTPGGPAPGVFRLNGDQVLPLPIGAYEESLVQPDGWWVNGTAAPNQDDYYRAGSIESSQGVYADRTAIEYNGLGGNDVIVGYEYDDTLLGGAENDVLFGGLGSDRIDGGAGNDFIMSSKSARRDAAYGTAQQNGLAAAAWISGSNGAATWEIARDVNGNLVTTSFVIDYDRQAGGSFVPIAENPQDADTVLGGAGDDYIWGGLGADVIDGGADQDQIQGLAGNDMLFGGGGNDVLYGDSNPQAARLLRPEDFTTNAILVVHPDQIVPLENHGNDFIDGGDGNDTIFGDGGDDTLFGGAGHDVMRGGYGNDTVMGGDGNDELHGDSDTAMVGVSDGHDLIDGGAGNDTLRGWGGNDTLLGGEGHDAVFGGEGNDTLYGEQGADQMWGGAGDDWQEGGEGDDLLFGEDGADTLVGGAGRDALLGGAGNDELHLDGQDFADGGAGDDTYVIDGGAATSYSGAVALIQDQQGDNRILLRDGTTIRSEGLQVFSQNGRIFATFGGGSLVALTDAATLQHLNIETVNEADPQSAGTLVNLQSIVMRDDAQGRVRSGVWADGEIINTSNIQVAQVLSGTGAADLLEGGSHNDVLNGYAGDDELRGGAGQDVLHGGAGSNTLTGGLGNDELHIGATNDEVTSTDTIAFNLGDGLDRLQLAEGADVSEKGLILVFGEGIGLADLHLDQLHGADGPEHWLTLQPGQGMVLAPGVAELIQEIRFADNTTMSRAAWVDWLQSQAFSGVTTYGEGYNVDQLLSGSAHDDRLLGGRGDDTLQGSLGNDLLEGADGSNRYVFGRDDGADTVLVNDTEVGELAFTHADLSGLTVTWHQDGILVRQDASNSVLLRSVSGKTQALLDMKVVDRNGLEQLVSALIDEPAPEVPETLTNRRDAFLDVQLAQLGTLGQRYQSSVSGGAASLATPAAAAVQTTFMLEGQAHEHGSYLRISTRTESREIVERTPVFETINHPGTMQAQRVFVPANSGVAVGGQLIPGSEENVFDAAGQLTGYWVSFIGTETPASVETRQIGWTTTTRNETVTIAQDSAVQERIVGTSGDDVVRPDLDQVQVYLDPYNNEVSLPVLFRGSVETGAGNDQILLGSGSNAQYPSDWSSTRDWGYLDLSQYGHLVSEHYYRGLGAWIDAGSGADTVMGTDGDDVIIGGTGADVLDGQAGSDIYVIGFESGVVDRIQDLARFVPLTEYSSEAWAFLSYGGDLSRQSTDVVEFESSVELERLTYRIIDENEDAGASVYGKSVVLQLFHDGTFFLEALIPLADAVSGVSLPGIDLFRFADGSEYQTEALLQLLALQPATDEPAITVGQVIGSVEALEDDSWSFQIPGAAFAVEGELVPTYELRLGDGSENLPSWLQFDPLTGTLSGTPGNEHVGALDLRITAVLNETQSATQQFTLEVRNTNDAPELASQSDEEISVGQSWTWSLAEGAVQDVDVGDSYSVAVDAADASPLPAWLTFDPVSGELSGQPGSGDAGQLTLRVRVTDAEGATAERLFTLQVNPQQEGTHGTALDDEMVGSEGNDVLHGGGGNDTIYALDGDDVLYGGDGNDFLEGGAGRDTLVGGAGDDSYWAVDLDDVIIEQEGQGRDSVVIFGDGGTLDIADFGGHIEVVTAIEFDAVVGTTGDDEIEVYSSELGTLVEAGLGNDTLGGDSRYDVLRGEEGADVIRGVGTMDGGSGNDTLMAQAHGPDGVTHTVMLGGLGDDWIYSKALTGSTAWIEGGAGNDVILIDPFASNTVVYRAGDGIDTVYVQDEDGDDTLRFPDIALQDLAFVRSNDDLGIVHRNDPEASVMWVGGFFLLEEPDDFHRFSRYVFGEDEVELTAQGLIDRLQTPINGWMFDDELNGGTGDDLLVGWDGHDTISGMGGDDVITAGNGNDVLNGGLGDDTLVGGSGNDIIVFGRGGGADLVAGSSATWLTDHDVVQFGADVDQDQLWFEQVDTDLRVSIIGTGDSITVARWYSDGSHAPNEYRIDEFKTLGGEALLKSQVDNLVSAMAAFSPPPMGQFTLDQQRADALGTVIAANWA